MQHRFRLLAATALVAVGFVGPAHADPISGAIAAVASAGSIGAAVAGAGTVGAFLLNGAIGLGVSLGLGALSSALQPKAKAGDTLAGLETQVQIGGDVARQICVGTTAVKGQLVYHNTNGANNEFYQRVYVLSDWRHDGLNIVFLNGEPHALIELGRGVDHVIYTVDGTDNFININLWNGRQGPTIYDAGLVSQANPPGKWSANSTLTGMTYVSVQFTYNKDAPYYANGVPELTFVLQPACLYDMRRDSTAGGSGPHRWDDIDTWEPSENPVVATYNYLRGFYLAGERIIGMGVPAYDFIQETWFAAANACDEAVTRDDGGIEPRYRCCTILTADEDVPHATTLEALLSTFAGYLYDYGGSYVVTAGVAHMPVDPITDGDLVIGAPVNFAAKRSRADLVNRIHGQFLDFSAGYQPQSYTAQVSEHGAINDGEELGRALDLMSVPVQSQAERIAKIRLLEARTQATATVTVGFHRLDLQVGDWLPWNSARFGTRTWRIEDKNVDAKTKAVTLQLSEINAGVYSWSTADEGLAPALAIRLQPGGRMSTVSGFGAQAVGIQSADGRTEIPGLQFFWNPITDETVDAVIIEYRQLGTTTATRVTDSTPDDGSLLVTSGIVNGTDYEFRATIRTTPARFTTWTVWTSLTTTDRMAFLVQFADMEAQLQLDIGSLQAVSDEAENSAKATLRDNVKALSDKVDVLANMMATQATNTYEKREAVKIALNGRVNDTFAAIETATNLLVAADRVNAETSTALAVRLTSDEANIVGNAAAAQGLQTQVTNINGAVTSLSAFTTTLSARIDSNDLAISGQATAAQSLTTRVTSAEGLLTSTSNALTALQSTVTTQGGVILGQSTAINSLTTTVAQQGDAISASATAVLALQASSNAANAKIQVVEQASIDRDNAFSGQLTTVAAQAAGVSASGQIAFVASAGPAGAYAAWQLKVTSLAVSSGFTVYAKSDGTSGVAIGAADFMVYDPNIAGGAFLPMFVITGGKAYFNLPVVVQGKDLEAFAATNSGWGSFPTYNGNVSVTTREGSRVSLMATFDGAPSSPLPPGTTGRLQILRNGTIIRDAPVSYYAAGNSSNASNFTLNTMCFCIDNPPAGVNTYTVQMTAGQGPVSIKFEELYR